MHLFCHYKQYPSREKQNSIGTGKEKCKTYKDMQMNQNSRGRKLFEEMENKKPEDEG